MRTPYPWPAVIAGALAAAADALADALGRGMALNASRSSEAARQEALARAKVDGLKSRIHSMHATLNNKAVHIPDGGVQVRACIQILLVIVSLAFVRCTGATVYMTDSSAL